MTNRLAGESSPYLRQHAENPVDWWPWEDGAFAEARERGVPVLLSVGYSSCHWCHVMAHESFEDPAVAALMNEWFVPVKVDREERPDIDSVYMEATQAMTGGGGWPMTVFMTPDGRPFYCGTYFPPVGRGQTPGFVDLMTAVNEAWLERRSELIDQAGQLTAALGRDVPRGDEDAPLPGADELSRATESLLSTFDESWGGFGHAPKFPQTLALGHLVRHVLRTGSTPAWTAVTTSLDAMASGGMVDLIGGGFSRYSVDDRWLVPHFEKMLYDNALLIRVYAEAAAVASAEGAVPVAERYAQVVGETIGYVLADLSHPEGGRYSAEDADSFATVGSDHAEEGAFYVFTPDEVAGILAAAGLGEHAVAACAWWGITDDGNFERRSIPNRLHARGMIARPPEIEACRVALHAARSRRPRPGLDDKVLTEWNALWVSAVAEAATMGGRPDWLEEAIRTAGFLLSHLRRPDGRWMRSWQAGGRARYLAYGSDIAALAEAFLALYSATGRLPWLDEARAAADQLLAHFWDPEGGIFTTGDDAEALLVRPRDTMDDATPSASSTAATVLLRLEAVTGDTHYGEHARRILRSIGQVASRAPLAFGRMLAAIDISAVPMTEIVVTGDRPDLVAATQQRFDPSSVLVWGERDAGPLWEGRDETGAQGRAYVCRDYVCGAPVSTVSELADALDRNSGPHRSR